MEKFHYRIAIKDSTISKKFIQSALNTIYNPNVWDFTFVDANQMSYEVITDERLGRYLRPREPYDILIADSRSVPEAKYAGLCACGIDRDYCKRIFVLVSPQENGTDLKSIALRIHHEILHGHGALADNMTRSPEFDRWLPIDVRTEFIANKSKYEHSSFYQQYYYKFLTDTVVVPQLLAKQPEPEPPASDPVSSGLTNMQKIAIALIATLFATIFLL